MLRRENKNLVGVSNSHFNLLAISPQSISLESQANIPSLLMLLLLLPLLICHESKRLRTTSSHLLSPLFLHCKNVQLDSALRGPRRSRIVKRGQSNSDLLVVK
jgi:hypothetical protein